MPYYLQSSKNISWYTFNAYVCWAHYTYFQVFLINPHNALWNNYYCPFFRWVSWDTERLGNLLKVAQLPCFPQNKTRWYIKVCSKTH